MVIGGAGVGVLLAYVIIQSYLFIKLRKWLPMDENIDTMFTILSPYVMYISAETVWGIRRVGRGEWWALLQLSPHTNRWFVVEIAFRACVELPYFLAQWYGIFAYRTGFARDNDRFERR